LLDRRPEEVAMVAAHAYDLRAAAQASVARALGILTPQGDAHSLHPTRYRGSRRGYESASARV
jgi:phosphoglycolate phosphatase-like HAD superfamily hydrolase